MTIKSFGTIPEGEFDPGFSFYLKNNTDKPIQVNLTPDKGNDWVLTTLFPGWNNELVKAVQNAHLNTLLYGNCD